MLRRACLAGSVVWAAVIPLAVFAASRPQGAPVGYAFALAAYSIGQVICHQLPVRSFHLWGAPLPVCARCTGIYLGAAVASVVAWQRPREAIAGAAEVAEVEYGHTAARTRTLLLAALVPTAITLAYEWTTGTMPANWIRALAGVPLGAAVAWLIGTANLEA